MPRQDGPEQSAQPDAKTLPGADEASPLAVRATELQGVRVGPFEIKGAIGSGGFGDVFLGEQQEPVHRLAAIKMLSRDRGGARFRALFEAERRVLAQIDHPNVARMLDAGCTPDGREWVAMEYAPGPSITAYCDMNRLSIAERVHLFSKVLRAVDFAHEKGVVHRDLKPSNILVSVDGGTAVPKIIDFGIARVLGGSAQATEPNRVIGTPGYMAPEQTVGGGADADARADVYSLGAVLFELCTGTLPMEEPGVGAITSPE
ncbi:MAG: serine/threonine protein kinase, partial [Phycisphaerae bacterium]|nr:serine/threonine protein kinase [Phycisphaerae bacterium]